MNNKNKYIQKNSANNEANFIDSDKHIISNMVERFVQTLSQINDSGNFDSSFEIKHIVQSPRLLLGGGSDAAGAGGSRLSPRIRHACITEVDRAEVTRFVSEIEARQANAAASTPRCISPYLCRKAKEIYQCACCARRNTSAQMPLLPAQPALGSYKSAEAEDLLPPPLNLERAQSERRSCRSAAKMLNFIVGGGRKRSGKRMSEPLEDADSRCGSPVLLRVTSHANSEQQQQQQELGCTPLPAVSNSSFEAEDEHDDGISSASSTLTTQSTVDYWSCNSPTSAHSRQLSPDSSCEMHAPLLPSFKVTPPRAIYQAGMNAAYEFARFLRGSFHAKRASVRTLRRSISDPDALQQMNFSKKGQTLKPNVLADATNTINSRALPANASPFRRAWGQSSFRTPRTDKLAKQHQQQHNGSPLVRRTASMTTSDNDTYMKSIENGGSAFLPDALKQARSQQQLVPQILTTEAPTNGAAAAAAAESTHEHETATGAGIGPRGWGSSFEGMLQDAAGMQTFSEFLKKEFSAENIYFWTACERYRQLESESERAVVAREIFAKHLSNSSTDPVNVDSQARNLSEEKLKSAASDIFTAAQKQIFNLMKFDSYQRFIRSDLYKSCVEAEQKQRPLPFSGADLDELLKTNFHLPASSKLKKSASNAEDRRRKSLLPWHRKTRSKSRDRNELIADLQNSQKLGTLMPAPAPPPPHAIKQGGGLSSSSLKIASTHNSLSDLHSSRSSLSSFDAGATGQGASAENVCSLCRVILTDGATTIVQTRPNETVAQLVERLLEKRGLVYPFYDIVYHGSSKSIDVQLPSHVLAGKEVSIERRVAFKLDLPDPKVISVKSKPKKQLNEVIRPILHKYNYSMSGVRVLLRDTQAPIDLMQPVTVADGQRLQIVLLQPDFQQAGGTSLPPKINKPMKPLPTSITTTTVAAAAAAASNKRHGMLLTPPSCQSKLDEITNKVFNELLQSKVEAASAGDKQRPSDVCSMQSGDAPSETSSLFERLRRQQRETNNIPGSKLPKLKKKSISSQHSEETPATTAATVPLIDAKPKPIIAKLKAGVKLQVTERVAEHQDELLEGLKRAQLARLEDQRGTEINFELPDFLKNKENLNAAATKLRKMRANLSPINKSSSNASVTLAPQPAPRLSITRTEKVAAGSMSPMKIDADEDTESVAHNEAEALTSVHPKGPPPLPPKPKVLPIKPSNWGVTATPAVPVAATSGNYCNKFSPLKPTSPAATSPTSVPMCFGNKITLDIGRKSLETIPGARCAYLDEPSSSFV